LTRFSLWTSRVGVDAAYRLRGALQARRRDAQIRAQFTGTKPWAIKAADGLLRPGKWRIAYVNLPIRIGASATPVALIHGDADLDANGGHESFVRSTLLKRSTIAWQSLTVNSHPIESGEFGADVWLIRGDSTWVLLDTVTRQALRWSKRIYSPAYQHFRRSFEQHVPSASFFLDADDPTKLFESYEDGRILRDLAQDDQSRVAASVLHGLAELVASTHARRPHNHRTVYPSMSHLLETSPIPEARTRRREIVRLLGERRLRVPSHGDLSDVNIIVTNSGPRVIDFDRLSERDFWFDATLLLSSRFHRTGWASGEFNLEVAAIWEAAGVAAVDWSPREVHLMLLAVSAVRAEQHRAETTGPLRAVRRRLREAYAASEWNRAVNSRWSENF
jgi:hypothetical protein